MKTLFTDKTSTGNKFEILTTENLTVLELKKYGTNRVLQHYDDFHKNLDSYYATKSQIEKLKSSFNVIVTVF